MHQVTERRRPVGQDNLGHYLYPQVSRHINEEGKFYPSFEIYQNGEINIFFQNNKVKLPKDVKESW